MIESFQMKKSLPKLIFTWNKQTDENDSFSSNDRKFSDEEIIAKANLHVEQAKAQHLYINELKTLAEAEKENEHSAQRFVIYSLSSLFFYFNNFLTQFAFFNHPVTVWASTMPKTWIYLISERNSLLTFTISLL
jgi:hypothetical protein